MSKTIELHRITAEANPSDAINGIDGSLVEKVWRELDGQLPLERVECIVTEVALGFQDVAVKTFLPIFIHRRALERLRQEINEESATNGGSLDE
jgi:hypothetical protein